MFVTLKDKSYIISVGSKDNLERKTTINRSQFGVNVDNIQQNVYLRPSRPVARRPSRKLLGLQRLQGLPGDPPLHEDPPHCLLPRAHPQVSGPERDSAQRPPRLQRLRKRDSPAEMCFLDV